MTGLQKETLDLVYAAMRFEEDRVNAYYLEHHYNNDEGFFSVSHAVRAEQEASCEILKGILETHSYTGPASTAHEGRSARDLIGDAIVIERGGVYKGDIDVTFNNNGMNAVASLESAFRKLVQETPKRASAPAAALRA